jgi:hypothetical protein
MHSVENLKILYRARRYWHTPKLADLLKALWSDSGDLSLVFPSPYSIMFVYDFLESLKHRVDPNCQSSRIFYEPCPVVKTTAMEVIVISQTMPYEITKLYPDFKAGGKFNVNKPRLQRDGKALHTRYGEYFYISVPDSAIAS